MLDVRGRLCVDIVRAVARPPTVLFARLGVLADVCRRRATECVRSELCLLRAG